MSTVGHRSRILIVDDDYDIRTSISAVLEEQGYSTVAVENGWEALEWMKHALPALILLDVMMPVMNGCQFRIEQMKSAAWRDIPVIVMTAKGQDELMREGMPLEGTQLVRKPFDLKTLLALVERCGLAPSG
jgi:CheY-like chemotaxis protein